MGKFKVGDLVRWAGIPDLGRPHLGIVVKELSLSQHKVQWLTDSNIVRLHWPHELVKAEV